jgi:hypothetical protein
MTKVPFKIFRMVKPAQDKALPKLHGVARKRLKTVTLAASIKPAAPSSQRQSIRCFNGTDMQSNAKPISPTCRHSFQKRTSRQHSLPANGLQRVDFARTACTERVAFLFAQDWTQLGERSYWATIIAAATCIHEGALTLTANIKAFWPSPRENLNLASKLLPSGIGTLVNYMRIRMRDYA